MKKLNNNRKLNLEPLKKALYMLQVLIIAAALPTLFVVEVSHKDKIIAPTEVSVDQKAHFSTSTVNI